MCVCVGCTCSTSGVSAADDVRVASVLRAVRCGVCEVWVARGWVRGVGGVWDRWVINVDVGYVSVF